ncbi:MAG: hypothetical protein L0H93_20485 [Nocardioides sp.]|nr:hypothetical protein [Nocardioides sp.]
MDATAEQVTSPALTAADRCDRCDRCGAQAYVEVLVDTATGPLPLQLCAHHHREHAGALTRSGIVTGDETHRLANHP